MTDPVRQRDQLVERLCLAGPGMAEVMTVYLGDTLGFYRALERAGPMTASELASRTGTLEGYAREWLEQQAAAGILAVDDVAAHKGERRYELPPGHVEPLLDPEGPYSIAPFCKSFVAVSGAIPDLVSAFRSGGPVPWSAFGRDLVEAQGDFNRPWLVGSLGTEYLPSIPDLHERPSTPSARVAGVADRVTFEVRDAADPALEGRYDVAIVVESIHDMAQPVASMRGISRMLKPGGTLIVADERTEDAFTAPASETERMFYAYSVPCCLPSAMNDHTSAATGTVMRRSTFERYANEAGFREVSVLPIEHDFLRFYRLDRDG